MSHWKQPFIVGLLLFFAVTGIAQEKTGERFSPSQLNKVEKKGMPLSKSILPGAASLKTFCPMPGDQSGGTCFAFASAYAGRTILYNVTRNNTSVDGNTTFSPGYIVRRLQPKRFGNNRCSKGASTIAACLLMSREGIVPLNVFPLECTRDDITTAMEQVAAQHKIEITSLFNSCDPLPDKVYQIKEALANKKPVVIGLTTTNSFNRNVNSPTKELWEPTAAELSNANCKKANHAICIIGYDDSKFGGAFEVLNSWGSDWKNGGFTWVKYHDLAAFLAFGIELSNVNP